MTIPSGPVPPTGTIGVGEIRADAQDRSLWLGVPASISAQQSVLISDIIGLIQADTDTLNAAKAYTDSGLATKSNTGHTHVISDIAGLSAALVSASGVPAGCIMIWSGLQVNIPAGWVVCDGNNGTPDLRERFVMGGGGVNFANRTSGGSKDRSLATNTAGAHSHGGKTAATTLTPAQMPQHNHTLNEGTGHTHVVNDDGHTHAGWVRNQSRMDSTSSAYVPGSGAGGTVTNSAGIVSNVTGITLDKATTGATIGNAGSSAPHDHNITADAGHTHNLPTFDVLAPYYVLCYIQKLP